MEADRDDIPGSLTRSSGHGRRGSLTQGPPDRQQATGVDAQCGAGAPDLFTFDFCNIRGLRSNFSSVEHHLATSSPDLLFLSETQLSANVSSDLFKTGEKIIIINSKKITGNIRRQLGFREK